MKHITYETAKLAKQIDFDENCDAIYNSVHGPDKVKFTEMFANYDFVKNRGPWYLAPYQYQLFEYLFDRHGYYIIVRPDFKVTGVTWSIEILWEYDGIDKGLFKETQEYGVDGHFDDYHDALEFALVLTMCVHILGHHSVDSINGIQWINKMASDYYKKTPPPFEHGVAGPGNAPIDTPPGHGGTPPGQGNNAGQGNGRGNNEN